jgi:mRNA-degrading endonuclease RelE of RelBE toxin-antitoxin system
MPYSIHFDKRFLHVLHKLHKEAHVLHIYEHLLNKLSTHGPRAGKLLEEHTHLYEAKEKHPPLRLYYTYNKQADTITLLDFDTKNHQKKDIQKLLNKLQLPAQQVSSPPELSALANTNHPSNIHMQ